MLFLQGAPTARVEKAPVSSVRMKGNNVSRAFLYLLPPPDEALPVGNVLQVSLIRSQRSCAKGLRSLYAQGSPVAPWNLLEVDNTTNASTLRRTSRAVSRSDLVNPPSCVSADFLAPQGGDCMNPDPRYDGSTSSGTFGMDCSAIVSDKAYLSSLVPNRSS
jgi:hypothetical protein